MGKYTVITYPADGHGGPDRILGKKCTLDEARRICRKHLGVKRLHPSRKWTPGRGVASDGKVHFAIEAYHDFPPRHPRAYGCGGVAVIEIIEEE